MKVVLEACVDSVESAIAATRAGADRFELCANLIIGGTTPSLSLFRRVCEVSPVPSRILIRSRFGDFCYTDEEVRVMADEVASFRDAGAAGVVIGALTPEGTLDLDAMRRMIAQAGTMPVIMHRAFDMVADPIQTLHQCIDLGIVTILTSGQCANALEGKQMLEKLHDEAAGHIEILAGGGVDAYSIPLIHAYSGVTSFHASGKILLESRMKYRNERVEMGISGMDGYTILRSDETKLRKARIAVDSLISSTYSS